MQVFCYTLAFENPRSKNLVMLDPEIEGSQFSRNNIFCDRIHSSLAMFNFLCVLWPHFIEVLFMNFNKVVNCIVSS